MGRKYLIETFGCQMNIHDSERMAGLLDQAGLEPTTDERDADVIVMRLSEALELIQRGEIVDGKTALGILYAAGFKTG